MYNLIEAISSWTEQKLRSILKNVLLIVLCPFVLFWFTDSDCPFGIFKLLLLIVLCPSVLFLIYGFWLPLWYLQTLIVDRCLSFYPFLFWSLHCLSSKLRFLITHLAPSRFFLQDRRYIIYSVHNYTNCITLIVLQCLSSSLSYIYGVGNILAYNQDVDIWFSVHDIFPEQPSSGTHIVKRLESQMI